MVSPNVRHLEESQNNPHYGLARVYWDGVVKTMDFSTREAALKTIEQLVIRMKEAKAKAYSPEVTLDESEKARRVWNALELVVKAMNAWFRAEYQRKRNPAAA